MYRINTYETATPLAARIRLKAVGADGKQAVSPMRLNSSTNTLRLKHRAGA